MRLAGWRQCLDTAVLMVDAMAGDSGEHRCNDRDQDDRDDHPERNYRGAIAS